MPTTRCVKIKLRTGSLTEVREWAAELNRRKDEVLETLKAEGVSLESVFLMPDGDGYALIYIMRADDFEKAKNVVRQSVAAIDAYHQTFKKNCWLEREALEALIDFSC